MLHLLLAGGGDGGGVLVLDGAGVAAASLNGADNTLGLNIIVGNLAEDDVLAIEPRGDDGGDEELGAVAFCLLASSHSSKVGHLLRVGAGVGHGQEEGLGVLQLEVLVGELLAVDGLAAGALWLLALSYLIVRAE